MELKVDPYQQQGFPLLQSKRYFLPLTMVQMQGLTQQELQDLYGASSPEISKFLYYYFWEWWNEKGMMLQFP